MTDPKDIPPERDGMLCERARNEWLALFQPMMGGHKQHCVCAVCEAAAIDSLARFAHEHAQEAGKAERERCANVCDALREEAGARLTMHTKYGDIYAIRSERGSVASLEKAARRIRDESEPEHD